MSSFVRSFVGSFAALLVLDTLYLQLTLASSSSCPCVASGQLAAWWSYAPNLLVCCLCPVQRHTALHSLEGCWLSCCVYWHSVFAPFLSFQSKPSHRLCCVIRGFTSFMIIHMHPRPSSLKPSAHHSSAVCSFSSFSVCVSTPHLKWRSYLYSLKEVLIEKSEIEGRGSLPGNGFGGGGETERAGQRRGERAGRLLERCWCWCWCWCWSCHIT